ncbi:MAG: hypothetical protein Q8S02_08715 [Hydrogenophaga sp.]|nr:hypothetical protein [Hydrogenophaga sp.]
MSKSYDAAKMATDFQARLTRDEVERLNALAENKALAVGRAYALVACGASRDGLSSLYLDNPALYNANAAAADTYIKVMTQVLSDVQEGRQRLAVAKSYIDTLQSKLNKPADGAA